MTIVFGSFDQRSRIIAYQFAHRFGHLFQFLNRSSFLIFELSRIGQRRNQHPDVSQNLILIRNHLIYFFNKRRLDLIFGHVRRFAWLAVIVFVLAAPEHRPILIVAMPHLPSEVAAALAADDLAGKASASAHVADFTAAL
ncbi:hypothetical protein SDC9_78255 [bioreactor metagenome]|uniref:Uncharacterized protein n=1 Tax=bioreactor metagenome TaxID=1076179 RepID=A0A644YUQ0_9ZZZZ